jgi:hypothetical protein
MAANRRATMLGNMHIQWTLSVRKTRSDVTSPFVKDIVGEWWSTQTRPSPNRKEVVRKWVAPKTYVQHHAQYLLESLVSSPLPFTYGALHFLHMDALGLGLGDGIAEALFGVVLSLNSNSVFSLKTLNTGSELPLSNGVAIVDVVNAFYLPPPAHALPIKKTTALWAF